MKAIDIVLGRSVFQPKPMVEYKGKKCLVTGCCGSIGREVFDLLLKSGAYVVGVDIYENGIVKMLHEGLDARLQNANNTRIDGLDYTFHCAAYKHVITGEKFEAVWWNNVDTTQYIDRVTEGTLVMASTDKAAGASEMGRSKKRCERILAESGRNNRVSVRLVNCAYSSGSVLSLWKDFMTKGGDKVGYPSVCLGSVSRYWMQLKDAAYSLLMAGLLESGTYAITGAPKINMSEMWTAMCETYQWSHFDCKLVGLQKGDADHENLTTFEEKLEETSLTWMHKII